MRLTRLRTCLFIMFFCFPVLATESNEQPTALPSQQVVDNQVVQFMQGVAKKYDFDINALHKLFNKAKLNQKAIDLMDRPYESKPWYIYQKNFITDNRIQQGVAFWHQYHEVLTAIAKQTGVAPEIIVAIIGVESHYGQLKGTFPALDVLYTFSFYYPRRETFFRNELKEFLLLCREQKLNPLTVNASYAGALGQPQFMPSSYRAYAKSYDGIGHINLFDSEPDVIASIANYFYHHGWQPEQKIAVKAMIKGNKFEVLLNQSNIGKTSKIVKPGMTIKDLSAYQVYPVTRLPDDTKVILMAFDLENNSHEYWLGLNNFYVITRYNTSKLYAMAVFELSELIKKRYLEQYKDE
jgi:membrane-bound lytic murein transglycosylase B